MNPVDLRVYGLVDPSRSRSDDLATAARLAANGGATLIQYRDKHGSTREMVEHARRIKTALDGSDVPLLINDRVDVALAAKADGVHLGQDDMAVADARRLLGGHAIIGLTIKNARHVEAAPFDILDYACIGGVFETVSKDNPDPPVGLAGLKALVQGVRAKSVAMPVGAIAGISLENAAQVIEAGAEGVAVISDIFMADDISTAAGRLRSVVDHARIQSREGAL